MSSHASTQDKSPDPGQALNVERKKTKVLKQALKQERKERVTLEQEFEKQKEQITDLNTQLQDKEKRYYDLYQEKMMLEETLIRESATNKLQNRVSVPPKMTLTGPPITFAGPTPAKDGSGSELTSPSEEQKAAADQTSFDPMNEVNFDVVPSPQRRSTMVSKDKSKGQLTGMVPQEQYDALKARFIENETATQRRLESINDLEKTIQRREEQITNMEKQYLQKLASAEKELEEFKLAAREAERSIQNDVKVAREEKAKLAQERDEQVAGATAELNEIRGERDTLIQEKNKLESFQDGQKAEIDRLETELHRAKEDVECRKLIIDELSKSMLHHEKESMDMAQKLTLMKNQIMENDAAGGMMHRYAAVRLGKIRHHPCTIEFVKGEEEDFFMVVDGRHETITINFNNIDQFAENDETGRLSLVYHMPAEPSTFNPNAEGMVKRKDEYECAENELITKTFRGIRNKLMGTAGDIAFAGHQFIQKTASTPQAANSVGQLI